MGDGTLMEFGSVVDAVNFALDVQRAMTGRNSGVPEDRQIAYRIGINIGDIIVEGDDIYGDGVNVAARLEGLAEPGGICIARNVVNQIKGKLDVSFRDMGEQKLKNIPEAVRAYQIILSHEDGGSAVFDTDEPLALPDKPSIAVLPFDNMSGDPDQEFLADGLAEDIITALSKVSEIFVIARNSTFAYKGKSIDVRRVASELGVRTVLEGSVRRAGNCVRITAQLIDAESGRHLWADRFDRQIADIFELQDEITQMIVTELEVKLTRGEQVRLKRRQTNSLEAWDLYVRALARIIHFTREDNVMARELAQRAIDIDAKFAGPWVLLARTHLADARLGWGDSVSTSLAKGVEAADYQWAASL
jgi:adenylate cyclase